MADSTTRLPASVAGVVVTDTGDEFYELSWIFRGRTHWACADGRVRYLRGAGSQEITAPAGLDLSTVDWRLGQAAYLEEITARVHYWLVVHQGGTYAEV